MYTVQYCLNCCTDTVWRSATTMYTVKYRINSCTGTVWSSTTMFTVKVPATQLCVEVLYYYVQYTVQYYLNHCTVTG